MITDHLTMSLEDSIKACDLRKFYEAISLNQEYRRRMMYKFDCQLSD